MNGHLKGLQDFQEEAYCRLQGQQVQSLDREVVEVLLEEAGGRSRKDQERQGRGGSRKGRDLGSAAEKRQVTRAVVDRKFGEEDSQTVTGREVPGKRGEGGGR